jgi:hypothetical protein
MLSPIEKFYMELSMHFNKLIELLAGKAHEVRAKEHIEGAGPMDN